jgi:hypothetical protein
MSECQVCKKTSEEGIVCWACTKFSCFDCFPNECRNCTELKKQQLSSKYQKLKTYYAGLKNRFEKIAAGIKNLKNKIGY